MSKEIQTPQGLTDQYKCLNCDWFDYNHNVENLMNADIQT